MTVQMHVREGGSGTPLLLLHAFPLSSAMWADQRAGLGDVCRVITPDQRGFGGSALGADDPSLEHVADDVAALLDAMGLDRVVLGGLSMGGYAALAVLRRHPERVRALVLADTKATADPPAAREKRERIAARLDLDGTTDVLVEEVLPALCGATTSARRPLVAGRVKALVEAAPPAAAAWAQRAMAARPDSLDVLSSAQVPVLVVLGDEDALSTREDAETMVAAATDARLEVLDGAGHLTAVEVPDAFNGCVRRFVQALG